MTQKRSELTVSPSGNPSKNIQPKNTTTDIEATKSIDTLNSSIHDLVTAIQKLNSQQTTSTKPNKANDDELLRIRQQQALFNLERSKLLAERQDAAYAEQQQQKAERKVAADEKSAHEYNPIERVGNAISHSQPGFVSKTLTAALTGGFGNLIGLDKVVGAGLGYVGGKISSAIGKPFQARAQQKEEQKAEERAINDAVKAAELNKKIQDILRSKGLAGPEGTGKQDTESNKVKPEALNKKTGFFGGEENEDDDSTTSSVEDDNPLEEQLLDKVSAIHETLLDMSGKTEDGKKEKKEEEEEAGSMFGGMLTKGLLAAGALALGAAAGAWISETVVGPAMNWLDENTNIFGGEDARQSMNAAQKATSGEQKDINIHSAEFSEFSALEVYMEETKDQEKSWWGGTKDDKVAERRGYLANAAKRGFEKTNPELVNEIDTQLKEGKITKEQADQMYIDKAKAARDEMLKQNEGKTNEQVQKEYQEREAARKAAEEAAKNGTAETSTAAADAAGQQEFTVMETKDHVIYGDLNKRQEQIENEILGYQTTKDKVQAEIDERLANGQTGGGIAARQEIINDMDRRIEQIEQPVGALKTFAENDDMYAVEINKDLLTDSGQLSEEGILLLKRQGVTDQQIQQISNVMNTSMQNNGSNVYQTNINQHSDTGVYATGDAARTMNMN